MKNKKILIVAISIIIICAIGYGIYRVYHLYLFKENGSIYDGHVALINDLKNVENEEERKKQIDFSLESNLITEKEANALYKW